MTELTAENARYLDELRDEIRCDILRGCLSRCPDVYLSTKNNDPANESVLEFFRSCRRRRNHQAQRNHTSRGNFLAMSRNSESSNSWIESICMSASQDIGAKMLQKKMVSLVKKRLRG